jgi:hypothetical protein
VRVSLVICSLLSLSILVGATLPDETVLLGSTDDSYVVADVTAPDDPQGLRDKNFGSLDFLKIWYAAQVQAQEQIVSVGLVKFDLAPLKDRDIRSAHLQLFALRADLLQPARLVDVSLAEGPWTEGDASFKSLPQLSTPALASAAVYGANVWYSWDVTSAVVRKQRDGSVAYAIGLRSLEARGEEQVVFAAREAGRNSPRLVVTLAPAGSPIPVYVLPLGVGVAALAAFAGGMLMGRRRQAARAERAAAGAPVATVAEDFETVYQCPRCHREIPSVAEVCPRCGARLSPGSAEREIVSR